LPKRVGLGFSLFLGGFLGVIGIYKIGKKVMFLPKLYFFMVLEVVLEVVLEQFGKNFFFRGTFVELLVLGFNKLRQNMGTSWE